MEKLPKGLSRHTNGTFIAKGTVADRFEDKIFYSPDGCWYWIGTLSNRGYGKITIDGKVMSAHRMSFEIYRSKIPNNLCVLHRCDNPSCVNPDHLFVGTNKDNTQDMYSKGRSGNFGKRSPLAKLTDAQVLSIRDAYKNGHKVADIQNYFKIKSFGNTWQIITGRRYKSIMI